MSDACTIYLDRINYSKVREIIEAVATSPVEVIGDADKWEKITVRGQSTLTFAAMESRPHERDEFSDLILGTRTFFQRVETAHTSLKASVITAVSECQFAIVFAITEAFGGLIFNGYGMVDQNGLMVLDKDGNSDLPAE